MDEAALRAQNGAYRTLNANLEQEIAAHRAKAREYDAAIKTLDSEREANAILTATIEVQARRIEHLDGTLRIALWNEMRRRGVSQDTALAAINKALASPPLPDTGLQATTPSASPTTS